MEGSAEKRRDSSLSRRQWGPREQPSGQHWACGAGGGVGDLESSPQVFSHPPREPWGGCAFSRNLGRLGSYVTFKAWSRNATPLPAHSRCQL